VALLFKMCAIDNLDFGLDSRGEGYLGKTYILLEHFQLGTIQVWLPSDLSNC
jgi:hypothetical protein